ncbi:MAG: MBL fold metallo-hydrolase [Pseudolysinimonas sp.]
MTEVASGVTVHTSEWVQTNTVVVDGPSGALVIDPGIHDAELAALAGELAGRVVAGFSTHPHWDHLLWHPGLGTAPRWATAACEASATARLAGGVDRARAGIPDDVSLDLLGKITALPVGATEIPWDGPQVRIVEHNAHAPGHAALVIADRGVLVAGDMLSDVLVPLLNVGADDPIGDYLAGLRLLEEAADGMEVAVPGHGSVARGPEIQQRIDLDRAYVIALRDGTAITDPRIGPEAKPGWEWVAGVHEGQVQNLAAH